MQWREWDFWHLVTTCPRLRSIWEEVFQDKLPIEDKWMVYKLLQFSRYPIINNLLNCNYEYLWTVIRTQTDHTKKITQNIIFLLFPKLSPEHKIFRPFSLLKKIPKFFPTFLWAQNISTFLVPGKKFFIYAVVCELGASRYTMTIHPDEISSNILRD